MSGLKHGEIEVSAEEQRRREQAARERREAERRRQEEERRERERARLTSALRQVEERASHAITQLRMLGVTVESTTAPSVGDDIDALRRSLAQGSSRAATLERQLASLQNELLAEIAACNLMIERANAQLQLARDRAAAHRQELKVPAAMPNVPSTLSPRRATC
ncbi:MAG: hypothetical protein IPF98_22695 [Gemmatimonadetes bacterium]|nr:hypothetical protein [Gemmatimonadota bacterium]